MGVSGESTKTFLAKIPRNIERGAAAFEQVFVQLHETLRGKKASFEILATSQNIGFCFTGEPTVTDVIASQIYGIAPDADIVEIPDPLRKLGKNTKIACAEVNLFRDGIFPIKDYTEFEKDSLSGILSVLSKCVPGEKIVLQFVVRPIKDNWLHQLDLRVRFDADVVRHQYRVKYWFKTGVSSNIRKAIRDKIRERHFDVNIRVAVLSSTSAVDPNKRLKTIFGALANFNTLDYNELRFSRPAGKPTFVARFPGRIIKRPFMLSCRELAAMYHLPAEKEVPNLVHVLSRRAAPPSVLPTSQKDPSISFFGMTNFRNYRVPFGIKLGDRRRHMYVVGKSGTGKSKLLQLLVENDLHSGRGIGILDPHGDLVDDVLKLVPKERVKDVILFDPCDLDFPASFNPLEEVPEELKMRVTIGFIEIFKKLFGSNWSHRLEHVLRYTTLALLDTPGTTVLSILKMLSDKYYRQMIVRNIQDNVVKNFWVNEFAGWSEKFDNEAITPLLNKVGQFVATNMIRNIVGQPINRFHFRDIMDNKKILLMKVSKGILGEENAALLGAMAITKVYQAAMSRADTPEDQRVNFYFYVDEFHNFATDSFDEILCEARKYKLNLIIANQFLGQLPPGIRKSVFGNVGTITSFRVGGEDSAILAQEYKPRFREDDIINLGVREFIIKMSVDGEVQDAFSAKTLTINPPAENCAKECIEFSRKHYSRPLSEVQELLKQWEEGKVQKQAPAPTGTTFPNEIVEFEEPLI